MNPERDVLEDAEMVTVSETEVIRDSQKTADALAKRAGTDRFKRHPWRSLAT
ncbi:hypothetical protein [Leptothermofonsia sp. ETS-13]|uniref:hypothetical protein n=1 Tax=Leptothermofonsia sp. ETS-13 TaxID=3035696 RepID=UPI003BA1C89E